MDYPLPKHRLLNSEKKQLYRKITQHIADTINRLTVEEKIYTKSELATLIGISGYLLSNYTNIDRYKRLVSDNVLAAFVESGIFSFDEFLAKETLSEREAKYIKKLQKIMSM